MKFSGFCIPGVGIARVVTGVAGGVIVVTVRSLVCVWMNDAYLSWQSNSRAFRWRDPTATVTSVVWVRWHLLR